MAGDNKVIKPSPLPADANNLPRLNFAIFTIYLLIKIHDEEIREPSV